MDLALTINAWIDEEVIFAQQLGARQVFARLDGRQVTAPDWDPRSLAKMVNRIEKAGLALAGLYAGAPLSGETQAWLEHLIRAAGASSIGLLSLSSALFPARRSLQPPIPAALAHLAEAASQAGVKLALPAARLAQGSPSTLAEMLQSLPGPFSGLDGTPGLLLDWLQSAEPGSTLRQLIQEKLFLVSFEHHRGPEAQPGDGFDELLAVCWRLRQAGYSGLFRVGRPLHWKGDTRAGHSAEAFTAGYLRAALQVLQSVDALPLR